MNNGTNNKKNIAFINHNKIVSEKKHKKENLINHKTIIRKTYTKEKCEKF